jgi:hypothetical protein
VNQVFAFKPMGLLHEKQCPNLGRLDVKLLLAGMMFAPFLMPPTPFSFYHNALVFDVYVVKHTLLITQR